MKGLYIACSPLLDKINAIKFGMSLRLQSRIFDYVTYFGSPYYYACYQFPDDHTYSEILYFEKLILKHTKQYHHPDLRSEFRYMLPTDLDKVAKKILNDHNVPYTYFNPITFKLIKNNCSEKQKHINFHQIDY